MTRRRDVERKRRNAKRERVRYWRSIPNSLTAAGLNAMRRRYELCCYGPKWKRVRLARIHAKQATPSHPEA